MALNGARKYIPAKAQAAEPDQSPIVSTETGTGVVSRRYQESRIVTKQAVTGTVSNTTSKIGDSDNGHFKALAINTVTPIKPSTTDRPTRSR